MFSSHASFFTSAGQPFLSFRKKKNWKKSCRTWKFLVIKMRWIGLSSRWRRSSASVKVSIFASPLVFIIKFLPLQCCSYHSSKHYLPRSFHAKMIKDGSALNLNVVNYILSLYVKSQDLDCVVKMFDEMLERDVRSWTILISGFARVGSSTMAVRLFREMQTEGVFPNCFALSSVLKSCIGCGDILLGKVIHGWILRNSVDIDDVLDNSLLDFYVKHEEFDYARKIFERTREENIVSCNIMLGFYINTGGIEKALEMFNSLRYRDTASWNTMIEGLMRSGRERTALELLYQMAESGPEFRTVTFSIALSLVSCLSILELGRQIHCRVVRFGIQSDGFVTTSLINMYSRCGDLKRASTLFRKMPSDSDFSKTRSSELTSEEKMTEIVSLSSIITAHNRNGNYQDAFQMFLSMIRKQCVVDKFTVTSIISACSNDENLELARGIQAYILKIGSKADAYLDSSLIDMYAKCGLLIEAWKIFEQNVYPNVVLWTSMISGCAVHGQGREAIKLFENMTKLGIKPNEITFVGLLTACSHAGMLEEGCKYFDMMKEVYGIRPGVEHFTCMVDLYGRAGQLNKIKDFIHENGIFDVVEVWKAFLSSCLIHKDIELGKWVCERLFQLDPQDPGPYIVLSNMCSTNHRWEEAAQTRSLMQTRRVKKPPGQSWVRLKNHVHSFVVGDRSHPQDIEIYTYLNRLIGRLKEIGYSSMGKSVLQDVEEEQGEAFLGHHSEKVAAAFAIISSSSGLPIQIMKNLRICIDCHNFMKFTSQLLSREIIVRDIHRFHHFKSGHCSCGDYW